LRPYLYRRAYAAFNRRDWEVNTLGHHPDEYSLTGNIGRFLPDAEEVYRGVEGYMEAMGLWISEWEDVRIDIDSVRIHDAPDGRVVSIQRWWARGRSSGVPFDTDLADVQTFRDGLLTSQTLFFDAAEALRFAGLEPSAPQ
jgi:ketosteroid isomerase-like protein